MLLCVNQLRTFPILFQQRAVRPDFGTMNNELVNCASQFCGFPEFAEQPVV